ncbi:Scr1 family TA system antitoxin-like transcriptional regulator [Streptomyces sp. NPDC056500]|uniref:helix-turn-helix domain-containing protein n=1 Tax=Streptomyces sp. NPDC056500 TaxID=3345840 RepID=UPI00368BCF93
MTVDPEQLGRSQADLAETLKGLRRRAGLSQVRLAMRCNMSQSKISKIENGDVTPSLLDVEFMLRALEVTPQLASEIMSLARLANTEWQPFRSLSRRGLGKVQEELATLESEAREVRYFLPAMISGLLATPEYVRASLGDSLSSNQRTVERKLERQGILCDASKEFTFLLTEQAVRWPLVPPSAMVQQIEHLADVSQRENVRIGVIPLSSNRSIGPMNTFTVYDDRLVTTEAFTGRTVFRDPRDVAEHLDIFGQFHERSAFGVEARALFREWSDLFR